jgi:hypothetical protein
MSFARKPNGKSEGLRNRLENKLKLTPKKQEVKM